MSTITKAKSGRCPYAVLNVPKGCDGDAIKDAYKRLSRLLHPDKRRPGAERDAAQESFLELTNAFEILGNNTLRQAYDHFGYDGVSIVRHNPHEADSLFHQLSKLHENRRPEDALTLLHHVLEDAKMKKRLKDLEFSADINVDLHLCGIHEGSGLDRLEVKSTNVSMSASVPMPSQTNASSPYARKEDGAKERKQVKLSIGGQSDLDDGLASSKSVFAATYKPRAETDVRSQLTLDRKHVETTLSSTHLLSSGTRMSAKMSRTYDWSSSKASKVSFGFTSNRALTMFQGRTVHAMFAIGVGSNLKMQYGVFSLVTWGFFEEEEDREDEATEDEGESDEQSYEGNGNNDTNADDQPNNQHSIKQKLPPPQLSLKLVLGSQFPIEMNISQDNIFHSPCRSGDAALSWGPMGGFKIKGMLNRAIPTSYVTSKNYESEFSSSLGIGLEHTPLSGLKWLLRYERPEGVSIQIPIFVSSVFGHNYLNDVIWYSALSFLVDETIGELTQTEPSVDSNESNTTSEKATLIQAEQRWLTSSNAMLQAEKQVSIMKPIAASKRKRETECNGLIITNAIYYKEATDTSLNVTDQLQFYVQDSKLVLPASSKSLLLGLSRLEPNHCRANNQNTILSWLLNQGDESKTIDEFRLLIRYKFKDCIFETCIGENESLNLPDEQHLNLGPNKLVS